MATGKALDGKPYAGNPHVAPSQRYGGTSRFDEGEVAPAATPRRGSLLYKEMTSAFCVFALMPLVLAASQLPAETVTTVCPKATDEALVNPGMGWVFYKYSNRIWAYGVNTPTEDTLDWFPGCSTMYLRLTWNDLEPEEGDYRWEMFDSYAQPWIAKGKKIALRVMTCSQVEEGTPEFVRKAGARGHWFKYPKETSGLDFPPRWEPVYDDPVFLEKLENFLAAMARRYDGDPNVAFIDVGSLGIYGEGNPRPDYPLTDDERKQAGTEATHLVTPPWKTRLTKMHVDLWRKHFRRSQLVALDGFDGGWNANSDGVMMMYCRENGLGFRDDSIFTFPPPSEEHPYRDWCHDNWARLFAPTAPVVVETCHYPYRAATGQWNESRYLECVEKYQASYLSIHDFPDEHLKRCRESIDKINRRLGYRFELREATYPESVAAGEKVEISSTWVNVGVSWSHAGAALTWSLVDRNGNCAWTCVDNSFDFKTLDPTIDGVEKPQTVRTPCRFGFTKRVPEPDNVVTWARNAGRKFPDVVEMLKPGEYTLCVSVGSRQGTPEIALPMKGQIGATRRYAIGKIAVR